MAVIPYRVLDKVKAGTADASDIPALLLMAAIPYGVIAQLRAA